MRDYLPVCMLLLFALESGCGSMKPGEPPDIVHEWAPSGGKIVTFSPSGKLLASGSRAGAVVVWRMPDGAVSARLQAHDGTVNGIAFVQGDTRLLTAGYDGSIALWRVNGRLLRRIDTPSPVFHMVADQALDRVVTAHGDGVVRIWRLADLTLLYEQPLHRGTVKAVALSPVERRYASSGRDGAVFVWREGEAPRALSPPPTDAWTLVFSPDGGRLFGGGWFRVFRWNLTEGTLDVVSTAHHGIIRSLKFTPDGQALASISRETDSSVYLLDPQTGKVLRRFERHELCGADVAVAPDGRFLATTSDDASVRIWDLKPNATRERPLP
jgi:WD40 repeat protein